MSSNTEGFQEPPHNVVPAVFFTPVLHKQPKIPIDETAGQQQKYSHHPIGINSIIKTNYLRDHPIPVQVDTFPAKIPWESVRAATMDESIHPPPPFLLPKITSETTSEESRARL